jgi:hypothetical protein
MDIIEDYTPTTEQTSIMNRSQERIPTSDYAIDVLHTTHFEGYPQTYTVESIEVGQRKSTSESSVALENLVDSEVESIDFDHWGTTQLSDEEIDEQEPLLSHDDVDPDDTDSTVDSEQPDQEINVGDIDDIEYDSSDMISTEMISTEITRSIEMISTEITRSIEMISTEITRSIEFPFQTIQLQPLENIDVDVDIERAFDEILSGFDRQFKRALASTLDE